MNKSAKQNYYDILDIRLNANAELVRISYIRAKNAYNRDSLATYSLFDPEESKQILEEIEEAYNVLSDSEKRRKYDEAHGFLSSESSYEDYRDNANSSETQEKRQEVLRSQPIARTAADYAPLRASYQVARPYAVDSLMEEKIRSTENFTGTFLKAIREYKQVSQEEIIDILKISRNYLTALESDDFGKLPATVFVRGFIIQYAKALKLDHERVAASYMRFLKTNRPA